MIKFASSIIPVNELFPKLNKPKFVKISQEMLGETIMTQEEAVNKFMPDIENNGQDYEKFTQIKARPANPGEKIETITADGKETENIAKEGDFVVTNLGGSGEEYIMPGTTLNKRYRLIEDDIYQAIGECRGVEYTGPDTVFKASWGQDMVLKTGDMIVTPLPNKGEVYRIAREEFEKTYRLKENQNF